MFAHSTTSMSRFFCFMSKAGGVGQLRQYLLWSFFSFSRVNGSFSIAARLLISSQAFCYILTKFQNYNLCESLIKSFEAPKSGKTTTTKQINKSLKKHHGNIYQVCHSLVISRFMNSVPPRPPKVTINLKSCKNKTKNRVKYFPATVEKIKKDCNG